jgi:hypothetical protein
MVTGGGGPEPGLGGFDAVLPLAWRANAKFAACRPPRFKLNCGQSYGCSVASLPPQGEPVYIGAGRNVGGEHP